MSTIGPKGLNPKVKPPVVSKRQNQQIQKNAVETEVKKAQTTNAKTLGRQINRTSDDKETAKTPKEKVSLSSSLTEAEKPDAEVLQNQAPETSPSDTAAVGEKAASPSQEKSADELKENFLNTFAGALDEGEARSIADKTSKSLVDSASGGAQDLQYEKVLAAHTYNHAVNVLSEKMPNASAKEIREAAKSDPEIAKAVHLLDSSSTYLRAVKNEAADGGNGAKVGGGDTPGGSAGGGVQGATGPVGPGDSAADPFAAHRSSADQPPGSGGQPPDAGMPQNPYHLSPEKQAQMMAENHQTQQEIQKIFAQMFADMQKSAAQRHQIMMETATAISDMMMQTYIRRQQSFANHSKAYLSLITGQP